MCDSPTDAERILWQHLLIPSPSMGEGQGEGDRDGHRFVRQYVIDTAIVDFACPTAKLAIELDGGQNDQQRHANNLRTQRLNQRGYRVLRFWNNEVTQDLEAVLQTIQQALNETNPE